MSNLNRNLTVLLHMKEYCEQIDKTLEIFGKNIEDFNSNVVFRNAISMPKGNTENAPRPHELAYLANYKVKNVKLQSNINIQ